MIPCGDNVAYRPNHGDSLCIVWNLGTIEMVTRIGSLVEKGAKFVLPSVWRILPFSCFVSAAESAFLKEDPPQESCGEMSRGGGTRARRM